MKSPAPLRYTQPEGKRQKTMNENISRKKVWLSVILIYLICFACRCIEYFCIRTDESFFGEAFIHKLAGIAVLIMSARHFGYTAEALGFSKRRAGITIPAGFCLGLACYAAAYGIEIAILKSRGACAGLSLYVTSYSVDGNLGNRTECIFFLICFLGNIINVLMEEGVFRGLFQKHLELRYPFAAAAVFASALFGLWHCAGPLRSFTDGTSSGMQFAVNLAVLVLTSALVGFKYALLAKLTGSLYAGMADHFVNNTIINILHVTGTSSADELQFIRVSAAQTLSFVIVLLLFISWKRREQRANGSKGYAA